MRLNKVYLMILIYLRTLYYIVCYSVIIDVFNAYNTTSNVLINAQILCKFSERTMKRAICQPTGGGFKKTSHDGRVQPESREFPSLFTFRNKSRRDIHIYYQSLWISTRYITYHYNTWHLDEIMIQYIHTIKLESCTKTTSLMHLI